MSLNDLLEQQIRLKNDNNVFKESTKLKDSVKKEQKALTLRNTIIISDGRQKSLNALESIIFPKAK